MFLKCFTCFTWHYWTSIFVSEKSQLHYSTCHEVLEDGTSHKVSKVVSWTVDLCKHSRDFWLWGFNWNAENLWQLHLNGCAFLVILSWCSIFVGLLPMIGRLVEPKKLLKTRLVDHFREILVEMFFLWPVTTRLGTWQFRIVESVFHDCKRLVNTSPW